MKAFRGSRGIGPLIVNLVTRLWQVVSFTPRPLYTRGKNSGIIKWEAGWAQKPVWTLFRQRKNSYPTRIRTPDHLAHGLVVYRYATPPLVKLRAE
jgi:hypothetical protein